MVRQVALTSLLYLASFAAYGSGNAIDIRLGDEAAQLEYFFESDSQIGIGGSDVSASFFFNENDDMGVTLGALVTGSSAGKNRSLQFGAGARLYYFDLDPSPPRPEDSVGGVAIGGKVSYIFPSRTPIALSAQIFYAPDIISFGDNDSITDWLYTFEVEIAPATRFYVGYRDFEVELDDAASTDYPIDESGHVGIRFSF